MNDRASALGCAADGVGVGEITDVRVSHAGRGHAVEATHALAAGDQLLYDGLADTAGGTSD
jgi:hypothetical protein